MNKWFIVAASLTLTAYSCDLIDEETEDNVEKENKTDDPTNDTTNDPSDDSSNNKADDTVNEDNNTSEAMKACNLINDIRKNPSVYSSNMGVDLSDVQTRSALAWNSALAKVAQDKAEDMAKNNYFSHTDLNGYGVNYFMYLAGYDIPASWYSDKSSNYFENIAAGNVTAEAMVKQLVYDSGRPHSDAGHRASLLGISDWSSNCTDIGIGYAYNANSTYKHYWSVIVAKHNY